MNLIIITEKNIASGEVKKNTYTLNEVCRKLSSGTYPLDVFQFGKQYPSGYWPIVGINEEFLGVPQECYGKMITVRVKI